MLVLEVRSDVYTVKVFRDNLLVGGQSLCGRRLGLVGRLVNFNAVHEENALVLLAQTFQHRYRVFSFVAPSKLIPQTS